MAFGQNSSSGRQFGANAKLYYVSIKQKDLPCPVFEFKRKKEGTEKEYEIVDNKAKFLSGNLIELKTKENKNKDQKVIKSVSAVFQDKDDVYFLTIHHDYLGWNILNSLCALKTFEGIEIGLYQSKPKAGSTKTYASVAVRQDGNLVRGAFENKDLPEVPKVVVGDTSVSDKTARTAFFITHIEALSKAVKAAAPAGTPVKAGADGEESDGSGYTVTAEDGSASKGPDDDIPF